MTKIKRQLLFAVILFILYGVTRFSFLTKLPIFTDEAIYIRWGQIALQDPVHRFISLEDGKQPLFIWLMLPALKFIGDPLVAGRLVSVIAGAAALVGVVVLARRLFGEKISWIAGLLYLITPIFPVYDRLALYDSPINALMVWSLFLEILLAQTLRLDVSLLLGMTIGAGLLTKSSAEFALFLLPLSLLAAGWKNKERKRKLIDWIGLSTLSVLLALAISLIIRLGPLSYMIGLKNHAFIVPFSEFLQDPFSRFWGNLGGLAHWTTGYLTAPLAALALIGGIIGLIRHRNAALLLLLWFALPFGALAAFGIVLYPRFLLFMLTPLLPLSALGIVEGQRVLRRRINPAVSAAVIVVLFAYPVYFSALAIADPVNAPLPDADRNQLLDDWPSGYGIPEVVDILKQKAANNKIFVGTEGTFGLTPSALEIYLIKNPNIQIKGYWPISDGISELIGIAESGRETYVLFKDTQTPRPDWPLTEIARFRKGRGEVFSILYLVTPTK